MYLAFTIKAIHKPCYFSIAEIDVVEIYISIFIQNHSAWKQNLNLYEMSLFVGFAHDEPLKKANQWEKTLYMSRLLPLAEISLSHK